MQKCFAAENVDFYSTVSSSSDTDMIKMTTDLFFNQLQSLDGYTVTDKRNRTYSKEEAPDNTIAFFAEIQEEGDGSWICTLNAIKPSENKNVNETKKYASYYKILLDAKTSLENLFRNLAENIYSSPQEKIASSKPALPPEEESKAPGEVTLDELSGTWKGEDFIEKILLLRGGRGFVIFKNGANMNISVSIQGKNVSIKQTSSSNASFFPEIPREKALKNAPGALPIEWNMFIESPTKLTGTKKTMLEDSTAPNGVRQGTISVSWSKS